MVDISVMIIGVSARRRGGLGIRLIEVFLSAGDGVLLHRATGAGCMMDRCHRGHRANRVTLGGGLGAAGQQRESRDAGSERSNGT
jgi:hypothetical protein